MDIREQYSCIYCNCSNVKVYFSRKNRLEFILGGDDVGSINASIEEDVIIPPTIECPYCKRKYVLLSASDPSYSDRIIHSLKVSNSCLESMAAHDIYGNDIISGCNGIAMVRWWFDSLVNAFKPLDKKLTHIHLIFSKDLNKYFLNIVRNNSTGPLANNLEVLAS